jgi:Omp85 superfamily domain
VFPEKLPAIILLGALLLTLSACTGMVPKKDLPYPLTNNGFSDPVKTVAIPLPVIASSPNEGITAGALAAFLLHNSKDEVSTLLTPQVNWNKNFGITATLYGAFYPTPDRFWEANLSHSTKVNFDYELRLRDKNFLDSKVETNVWLYGFDDGSARFYGFEHSRLQDETNYGDVEYGFTLTGGYELFKGFQIILGERFRHVSIGQGAVTTVPFIRSQFSEGRVPGVNGFIAHAQKLAFVYSTLDSPVAPTSGLYFRAGVEASATIFGSSADYRHYDAEVKGYLPLDDARFITVGRIGWNQTLTGAVPFLERSILGGENSLRGYGRNRFIDNTYLLCNIEERIRLFRWEIFNVTADWEVAPFIDLGAITKELDTISTRDFELNPGIGFRATVRPNIVGRVDIGFGKEGPAVFVGLGYPF